MYIVAVRYICYFRQAIGYVVKVIFLRILFFNQSFVIKIIY